MSEQQTVVIAGAKRTPIGSFQGQFATLSAVDLGAAAIAGAVEHAGIDAADVGEVIMGCVLPAGLYSFLLRKGKRSATASLDHDSLSLISSSISCR